MMSALDCRAHADRCEKMADKESDKTNRRMLLAIAGQWRRLAATAEKSPYPVGKPMLRPLSGG